MLGDGSRWRELFELNQGRAVGPDGESWTESWRLLSGWELQLPPGAGVTQFTAPDGLLTGTASSPAKLPALGAITEAPGERAAPPLVTVGEHVVGDNDSYWSIAETQLGIAASGSQVNEQTQALMDFNAPRLGYSDPGMLQSGDVVMLVAPSAVLVDAAAAEAAIAAGVPYHVVVDDDSYWAIATERAIELYGVDGAYASRVFELSEDLQDLNWPRLGYEERPMLQAGDVVFLEDPAPYLVPQLPPPTAGTAAPVPVLDVTSSEVGGVVDGIEVAEVVEVADPPAPAIVMEADVDAPVIDADIDDDADGGQGWVSMSSVLGLSALATAGAAGLFAARRRRASRGRAHQRPAPLPEHLAAAAAALSYADGSHVNWLALELRWLVHHCAPALRTSLMVEEIQVGHDRDVEIAFASTPLSDPPAGWTMVAERIWQLDRPHTAEELAEWAGHAAAAAVPGHVGPVRRRGALLQRRTAPWDQRGW